MNFNVWNIKEMLSIPSGSGITKPSNWNSNQTDCSSPSDSQFLFGSQFCPENSESLSTSLDVGAYSRHPKQTQQNSVDNEPSIFTKYQTKPQLFGGDTKDEGLFSLPLPIGKSKGLLKQFEEKKRRATDKCDRLQSIFVEKSREQELKQLIQHIRSLRAERNAYMHVLNFLCSPPRECEMLYNFVSHFQEVIHKLQTSVEKSEENLSSRSQSISDSLETIAKTFQENAQAQRDLMFEAVRDKGNMEQAILEFQKRSEARQAEFLEMKSDLKNLEVLVTQQSKIFQQLCEKVDQLNVPGILEEMKKLFSAPQVVRHLKDSTSQTSPALAQSLHFTRQEKCTSEAQVSPAGSPSKSSQRRREFGVWDEGAESGVFQKAALPTDGPQRGNEHLKNVTMPTYCKNWVITTRSLSNPCSSLPSQKASGDKDLVAHEASQLDLNKFEYRVKNEAQSMCSSDRFEQSATEQKGRTRGKGRKGRKQQPRKSQRGRPLARKQEQTPRKACAFVSRHRSSQTPDSSPQGPLICLRAPRSSTKSAHHMRERTVRTSKTARTAPGSILQSTQCSSSPVCESLSSSSQGDQQINWFSNLSLEKPEPPLCKKGGKNLLCDPDFDSSDDNF